MFNLLPLLAAAAAFRVGIGAGWAEPPFAVQLVEAAAGTNESLYPAALRLLVEEPDEFDLFDDSPDDSESFVTEEALYRLFAALFPDPQFAAGVAYKTNTPRIEAQLRLYAQDDRVQKCVKDSFGLIIEDPYGAYVEFGDDIYCSGADLYALKTLKKLVALNPLDRVVGENDKAPIAAFYATPNSARFVPMLRTLLGMAELGQLRFVWRYVPELLDEMPLNGYGVIAQLKNEAPLFNESVEINDISETLDQLDAEKKVYSVAPENHFHLGLSITSWLHSQQDKLGFLSRIVNNLPLYAGPLALYNHTSTQSVKAVLANEKKGTGHESVGAYVNGARIHNLELDVFSLYAKIKREAELVASMAQLGFLAAQAKLLFSKFALLSAYKEAQFRSGYNSNRYAIYKEEFVPFQESGGLVYFNDVETDDNYQLYATDAKEAYIGESAQVVAQIPALRENVHDLVLAINLSSRQQLRVFFALAKAILDRAVPQQVGIIPLVDNDLDRELANRFFHVLEVGEVKEGLALLYKYLEAKTEEEEQELFEMIQADHSYTNHLETAKKYGLDEPSVICNGVVNSLRGQWQLLLGNQISTDVHFLKSRLAGGERGPLRNILYALAKHERNTRVIPKDPGNVRYKRISQELIDHLYVFASTQRGTVAGTFWLLGDFNSPEVLAQFVELLKILKGSGWAQIRVLNLSSDLKQLKKWAKNYKVMTNDDIERLIVEVQSFNGAPFKKDPEMMALLAENQIQLRRPAVLFNSRYFPLTLPLSVDELKTLLQYEQLLKLDTLNTITDSFPEFKMAITDMHADLDWFDMTLSVICDSFFSEDPYLASDVSRFDFASLDYTNGFFVEPYDESNPVDVLFVVDPLNPDSQKLVALAATMKGFNCRVLVQPMSDGTGAMDRFYSLAFGLPEFESGKLVQPTSLFDLPETPMSLILDVPQAWHVVKGSFNSKMDPENFTKGHDVMYTLGKIVVDVFLKDVELAQPIPGLTLQASAQGNVFQGTAMLTFGYLQLRLEPGHWFLELKKYTNSEQLYHMLSASGNKYDAKDTPGNAHLDVVSLAGHVLHPRFRQKAPEEIEEVGYDIIMRQQRKHAPVNVFTIASGHLYEELVQMMMVSVKKHTEKVKFWLVENFVSPKFKDDVEALLQHYGFQYEFVSYKWPAWLRQQRHSHRIAWGYKILFLDVIFPDDLDKVVFVDADQIARTDLKELVEHDLQGAAYGFAPMCEDRNETAHLRFWEQGYWPSVLKDDLKYHISALFVVDLVKFRQDLAGDKLRMHYQRISADPNSLANLDQDLPNNMQRMIPIHSLPQEWLWCETWCAESRKADAKMIDLCNNPVKKEGKLELGARIIPDWDELRHEVQGVTGSEGGGVSDLKSGGVTDSTSGGIKKRVGTPKQKANKKKDEL